MTHLIDIDTAGFLEKAPDLKLGLLFFVSGWCATCKEMEPAVQEIASLHQNELKAFRINFDDNMDLAADYGVMVVPTLVLVNGNSVLKKLPGLQPLKNIAESIAPYANGAG